MPKFQLAQLIKFLMVEQEIWGLIYTYTKNQLMSWSDDKEHNYKKMDIIGWNSIIYNNNKF